MKRIASLTASLLAAFALDSHAAQLAAGTQELRLQGLLDSTTLNGSEFDFNVSYGYFFVDNVQAGARINLVDNDDLSQLGLGAYVEYNVDTGNEIMPFGEFAVSLANVDIEDAGGDNTAGILELRAGAKYFLVENVAIALAGVFAYATDEIFPDDGKIRDNDVFLELSLRCYF
ncbi:MAG TPA: hypothetical protein PKE12_03920 [Kiritimatiellia bacterium]|nr:hypothetical protein [Kiritimatiellia bacterium]